MELDFSQDWRILGPEHEGEPAAFAAAELCAIIGRMGGRASQGGAPATEHIIVLNCGQGRADEATLPGGCRRAPRHSWRASADRVEIYGEDGPALLRSAYDFLDALGARWVEPGPEGERLPRGPGLVLDSASRASEPGALPATLILGHGAFLEDWEERLLWAARVGYTSVFIHTTPDALAMGAAPESLYEALRPSLGPLARRLGLRLELGGHGLSSLLPRSLFKTRPGLFREKEGLRRNDRNLCPSSAEALEIIGKAFASRALAHPEVSVFHSWPDDLPGGGWCSCPKCASLSPAAQSLKVALSLASALAPVRPDAALAFLAYHDTEDTAAALAAAAAGPAAPGVTAAPADRAALPPNLELLWAPRLRSWGSALGEAGNSLNAASLAAFRRSARAWRAAGGGRVSVFEYWEDAVLFKGAVPPLARVLEGDLSAYRRAGAAGGSGPASGSAPDEAADTVGILCTGGRLPLGPRPNPWLLPRLAALPVAPAAVPLAPELLADWARAAYGPGAAAMTEYWAELEAAWAIDLDIEEGDTALHMPDSQSRYAADPPADWGDPWTASLERLAYRRGRCEELFDHLRRAETLLSEARKVGAGGSREERAVLGESSEYAISGALLELDCARLSAYHELAGGDPAAAADIANIALSASKAMKIALSSLGDRRARREIALLIELFYDLRLRSIRRANARSALRRLIDLWFTTARAAMGALRVAHAYEQKGLARGSRKR